MANNLGTLNQLGLATPLGSSGIDTFNKYLGRQIAANGSDTDKLAYLLGSFLGNNAGTAERKSQEQKLSDIISNAQQAPVQNTGNTIGAGALTPEQQQQLNAELNTGLQVLNNMPASENTISAGANAPNIAATDEALRYIAAADLGNGQTTQAPTNGGMNNYNWNYIKDQARQAGIVDSVVAAREADIKNDIAQKAREIYLPQIQQDMYGSYTTDENGKRVFQPATTETMLDGMQKLNELSKYDPTTAATYSTGIMKNLQGDRDSANKLQNAITIAGIQTNNAIARDNNTARNAIARDNNTAANTRANAAYYTSLGYNAKGGNPAQQKQQKVTLKDYNTAVTGMNSLIDTYGRDKVMADPMLSKQYETYAKTAQAYDNQMNGNTNVATNNNAGNNTQTVQTTTTTRTTTTNPVNKLDQIFSGINDDTVNNYDTVFGDDGVFSQAKDYMRTLKDKNGKSMSEEDMAKALTAYAKSIYGEDSQWYQDYAHAQGIETDTDKAIAAQEAALATDKKLNPQKYGIDPYQGIKDFFSGNFDDSYGQSLKNK